MRETKGESPRRRGSVFGPLLLIAIGVVFLLKNVGLIRGDIWQTALNLWPVLLIVFGLDGIYRGEGLVGGVFLIGLGTVFTLANLGYLAIPVWQLIFRLWPVLLIAVGLDLVLGKRSIWASIAGLVLVLAILAGALVVLGVRVELSQATASEGVSQALGDVSEARVLIAPAAGDLRLSAMDNPEQLLMGRIASSRIRHVAQDYSERGGRANLVLRETGTGFYPLSAKETWMWDVSVTTAVPLVLDLNLGAGNIQADLAALQLEGLNVDLGVGRIELVVPQRGSFAAQVEAAIGQIVVYIPQGTAVKINTDTVFVALDMPDSYQQQNGAYTSPEFDDRAEHIELNLGLVFGSIVVKTR